MVDAENRNYVGKINKRNALKYIQAVFSDCMYMPLSSLVHSQQQLKGKVEGTGRHILPLQ